jgi:wyosine [tRNA(Phe)-imidazoG37] synthetase (radical SAM superfamily)
MRTSKHNKYRLPGHNLREKLPPLPEYDGLRKCTHPVDGEGILFGPVPSRRLGNSLGVNTITRKACTYDCVYCQVGRTTSQTMKRGYRISPTELFSLVKERIKHLENENTRIDYISFVPNGEPTLDISLVKEIAILKEFGYKVAVFTNSSLLWNARVRDALLLADYVSVKADAVDEGTWHAVNRPHRRLRLAAILDGIKQFSEVFPGILTTETMLVRDVNDSIEDVNHVGSFLATLKRNVSYFTIPIRPPAVEHAVPPDSRRLKELSRIISSSIADSEMLFSPEHGEFNATGNIEEELRSILAVHPMREDEVETFIKRTGGRKRQVDKMVHRGIIRKVRYDGRVFYVTVH